MTLPALTHDDQSPLAYALAYAEIGWRVFPVHSVRDGLCSCGGADCARRGKHPRITSNLTRATTDPDKIREWWTSWPDANVAVATGEGSGFYVVDVDPRNGGDATYADLGEPEADVRQRSGGGGDHLCYATNGRRIPSKNGVLPGIDLKGEGGYFVVAPSGHELGGEYVWLDGQDPLDGAVPGPAPEGLIEQLLPPERETSSSTSQPPIAWERCKDLVREALPHIPSDDRDIWLHVGMALKRTGGGDEAYEVWCEWSKTSAKYNDADQRNTWASITDTHDRPVTVRSIFHQAQQHGWECELNFGPDEEEEEDRGQPDNHQEVESSATPAATKGERIMRTDSGNAERFVRMYGAKFRYCHPWKKALLWNGRRWRPDDRGRALGWTKRVARSIYSEAAHALDQTEVDAYAKWAADSEKLERRRAMLTLATVEEGMALTLEQMDRDPFLLNVRNGTIDLRTGELREHRRSDYMTKIVPYDYDPDAKCPLWERFLEQVLPDREVREFVQRAVGYSLTADVSEQVLFFLYGEGSNGKSVFVTTVQAMLGPDFAIQADSDLLLTKTHSTHPTERADLFGARFVACTELGQGRSFDEPLVKQLTGGDRIRARRMREDFWEFAPSHKLWISANHQPQIRGTDHAIWRRILIIPFLVRFDEDKQDRELPKKLLEELPGILAWAVRGLADCRRQSPPAQVRAARDAYRSRMDVVSRFLDDCCERGGGLRESASALFREFERWCSANRERAWSQTDFGQRMTGFGFGRRKVQGLKHYLGVALAGSGSGLGDGWGQLGPEARMNDLRRPHEGTNGGVGPNHPQPSPSDRDDARLRPDRQAHLEGAPQSDPHAAEEREAIQWESSLSHDAEGDS